MIKMKSTYKFKRNSDGYYICRSLNKTNIDKEICLFYTFPAVENALVEMCADSVRIRWNALSDLIGYYDKYGNIIVRVVER